VIDPQALERRYDELARELEAMNGSTDSAQRAALRRRIVELYQEIDADSARLAAMRQAVQALGERFRNSVAAGGSPEAAPPARPPAAGRIDPHHPPAPRRAEDLDVSTYLDRAWNCLATCRYEDALGEVTRALERLPASAQAETLRGWALMRLDRLGEARQVLEEVLRADAAAALARASLGYVAFREGRDAEAIDHLSRAARDGTDRKAVLYAHLYLGMLYTRREMFRDGRSFLSRAIELGPSLVEAYWEMGRSYYLEGQFTQALDTWRRGAEVNRFDPWGERCQEAVARAMSGGTVLLE
jgi:tetratricopeptide (TPR) repeat protein